jgi:trk system potassium uptake protein TrkH
MLVSSLMAWYLQEAIQPFILSAAISLIFSSSLLLSSRKFDTNRLSALEASMVVSLTWLGTCLLGALPFYLGNYFYPNFQITLTDSLFESISGFTTTGATIFDNVEILPKSLLFWRSFSQWIGGMGIVILAIAILPKLGVGGLQAFKTETTGPLKNDKLMPRISETAKILYRVYLSLSILLLTILILIGVDWFDALIHTFSTIATGGFSNFNNSVAGLQNPFAEYIISIFMILSSINFSLIFYTIWQRNFRPLIENIELKVYLGIFITAIAITIINLQFHHFENWNFNYLFRHVFFQISSIISTTGFSTLDYSLWPSFSVIILITLMFIGGCTGSTSGSLKVLRHLISFKFIKWELYKIIKPKVIRTIKIGEKPINNDIVNSVMALITLFGILFILGTAFFSFYNIDIITSASISIAGLAGIGPALNQFGPMGNYAELPESAKYFFMLLMFIGRLEIVTVLTILIPSKLLKK